VAQNPAQESRLLLIVRHGERYDDPFVPRRERPVGKHFSCDPPLCNRGFNQAYKLGQDLHQRKIKVHRIISSPYQRTLQTSLYIRRGFPANSAPPICIEHGLSEWTSGRWFEDMLPQCTPEFVVASLNSNSKAAEKELASCFDREHQSLFPPSYFRELAKHNRDEPRTALLARAKQTLEALEARYPGETLLLVSHAATKIMLARAALQRHDFADMTFNCGVTMLQAVCATTASPSSISIPSAEISPSSASESKSDSKEQTDSSPTSDSNASSSSSEEDIKSSSKASQTVWSLVANGETSHLTAPHQARAVLRYRFAGEEHLYWKEIEALRSRSGIAF